MRGICRKFVTVVVVVIVVIPLSDNVKLKSIITFVVTEHDS